jgi:hypothetical protein
MNFCCLCAQLVEDPREVYTSATSTAIRCQVTLPPVGNKAPTTLEYTIYGKQSERFQRFRKGGLVYIHGAKLRYDLDAKQFSVNGGIVEQVTESFPILNSILLAGRCVKDIGRDDARAFKTTADGLMITNQTLSVNTGRNQADLFNFYAINNANDKLNQAELLVNFTRKGTGITIQGRLVTDRFKDNATQEMRHISKIQLVSMTLAPRMNDGVTSKPVASQTTVANPDGVSSLWGGRTAEETSDPWNQTSGGGLPDFPGQYGSSPELEELPF